ncbi:proteinase inhibitor [Myroides marinus]|uniref:ecotin n=1 Tax=Myroides marinus TaxID=703342 RepID=UPI000741C36D|nr:ecotin family protein [Myroides marinus]KUF43949.1 proteinase inhibitor [Myroides marinus]MDM1349688.1 proteinase inhibitor [Myroides marinus]MDM1356045.1 proteinase inhibitor [Myroides marinus]MDM1356897.1 proteinase inhibitor [Myroides marinus]MDM1364653.1 proteinase inhibitor [Myroides marinus]
MKRILSLIVAFFGLMTATMAQTITRTDVSIFPAPEKGYKQVVIDVPHSTKDDSKKIEFTVGKMMEVDGCNHFSLLGTLEQKDLQGWGYSYYVFNTKGDVVSTMMACPDAHKKHSFVSGQPELARYNGKLPIVVYVPEEYEVRFKIYTTDGDEYQASEVRRKK